MERESNSKSKGKENIWWCQKSLFFSQENNLPVFRSFVVEQLQEMEATLKHNLLQHITKALNG